MEFYDDDYEDELMDYEELIPEELDEDLGPVRQGMTVFDLYEECVVPTFHTAGPQLKWLFISCLMLMIFTKIAPSRVKWGHLASSACGLLGLYALIGTNMIYTVVFGVLTYRLVVACHRQVFHPITYHWAMGVLFLYLVFREYVEILPEAWVEVRGIQMIMVLKCLSVAEAATPEKGIIPFFNYLGYLFCPASLVFGPWMPYLTYVRLFEPKRWEFGWLLKVISVVLLSMICLTGSTCWVYWIFADLNWKWARAARDAVSFRLSHYFVAFTSEAMCLMSGFYSNSQDGSSLNVDVVKPLNIELPRSLREVVCSWNLPMHQWLKQYIFLASKNKFGLMIRVILTFLVSSLLHGLNFSLSLVLLSLGFYAYAEGQLREKLATIFNACVRSRACKKCEHHYRAGNLGVAATNLMFGFLAYFHLVYLGVLMDNSREAGSVFTVGLAEKLKPWQNLNFLSHWVFAATFLSSWAI